MLQRRERLESDATTFAANLRSQQYSDYVANISSQLENKLNVHWNSQE